MVLASPNDQEYPRYPLVLKFNDTLAPPLCLVILFLMEISACIIMTANETQYLMWMYSSIQKQLLNLYCIVYKHITTNYKHLSKSLLIYTKEIQRKSIDFCKLCPFRDINGNCDM